MKQTLIIPLLLLLSGSFAVAQTGGKIISPPELWKSYDSNKGDFKEEIISQEIRNGIINRDTYISAYVLGEEIRVYCRYSVKEGAKKAPGLLVVHGWMGAANPDKKFVVDGLSLIHISEPTRPY